MSTRKAARYMNRDRIEQWRNDLDELASTSTTIGSDTEPGSPHRTPVLINPFRRPTARSPLQNSRGILSDDIPEMKTRSLRRTISNLNTTLVGGKIRGKKDKWQPRQIRIATEDVRVTVDITGDKRGGRNHDHSDAPSRSERASHGTQSVTSSESDDLATSATSTTDTGTTPFIPPRQNTASPQLQISHWNSANYYVPYASPVYTEPYGHPSYAQWAQVTTPMMPIGPTTVSTTTTVHSHYGPVFMYPYQY